MQMTGQTKIHNNMDKPTKFTEIANTVIGYIGYFLISLFIAIFYVIGALSVILAVTERDLFNLVGVIACAGLIWMLKSLKQTME